MLNVQLLATQGTQNGTKNSGLVDSKESSSAFEAEMNSATEQQRQQESTATNSKSNDDRAAEENSSGNGQPEEESGEEPVASKPEAGEKEDTETEGEQANSGDIEEAQDPEAELLAMLNQNTEQVELATVVQTEVKGIEKSVAGVSKTPELLDETAKKNNPRIESTKTLMDGEVKDQNSKELKSEQLQDLTGKLAKGEKNNIEGRFTQQLSEQMAESGKQSSESSSSLSKIGTRIDNSGLTQLQTDKSVATTPELQTKIHTSFHKQEWQQAFNQRFMWMVSQGASKALIQLEPAELGPMEVKMQVAKDSTVNVSFTSHSSAVRDILDSQIPRLRELLEEQGLTLGDVDVGGGDEGSEAAEDDSDPENKLANDTQGVENEGEDEAVVVSDRLLDTFV